MTRRSIHVDTLARVEGEGALHLTIRDGTVEQAELNIFEPPRFFEAFLRGRHFSEAPDLTARICGICPVAYQISSVLAMEQALGVTVDGPVADLRRLLYCGEWIESHALHVYMLHAPDFLGYASGLEMAKDHTDIVRRGLALKKVGNDIMALLGGREIHPINVRVGGFYKAPRKRDLAPLTEKLKEALEIALETVRWTAGFDFPDCQRDYEFVALRDEAAYAIAEGRIVSNRGLDIPVAAFEEAVDETHVAHSTALHARIKERGDYLVGPLARYSLNSDRLSPLAAEAARAAGLGPACANPFQSIVVRGVEMVYACEEGLRLIETYVEPDAPAVDCEPRESWGAGASEAPRGLLYHAYRLDADGLIEHARIMPPTSQNQPSIEADLAIFAQDWLGLDDAGLRDRCEQAIRNYDPCISCATHFLDLRIDRA